MIPFLDLKRTNERNANEIEQAVKRVVRSGWYIGGEEVDQFEEEFAKFLNAQHVISCGSATDGLELALRALSIGIGDEVILPDFNWVSGVEAVLAIGATPVLVDVGEHGNITLETVKTGLSEKSKAIIGVHMFGLQFDANGIKKFCDEKGLFLIEDAAHAHGASIGRTKVGTIGHIGVFSFYPTKLLGALGDGGALVTNDDDLAHTLRLITNHGQVERDKHISWGKNSRLDAIQAAVLRVKLKGLDELLNDKKVLAENYLNELRNTNYKLPENTSDRVWHQFTIRHDRRDDLQRHLKEQGIQTAIHYPTPMSRLQPYSVNDTASNQIAFELSRTILSLPLFPELTSGERNQILDALRHF